MPNRWGEVIFKMIVYIACLIIIRIAVNLLGMSEIEAFGCLIIYLLVSIWIELLDGRR